MSPISNAWEVQSLDPRSYLSVGVWTQYLLAACQMLKRSEANKPATWHFILCYYSCCEDVFILCSVALSGLLAVWFLLFRDNCFRHSASKKRCINTPGGAHGPSLSDY
ncbi:unnamed protein product [Urochloa humidicola]